MTINQITEALPDYAHDMKINLNTVLEEKGAPGLTTKQIAIIALSSALATPSKKLIEAVSKYAEERLSENELDGARTAHAIMSMTNVYYRFLHVCDNEEYKRLPPHLSMKAEAKPGISKKDFHLASIGVSSINYCKACIDYHELAVRRMGVSAEGVQSTVRIAAILNAVGQLLKF